MKSIVRSQTRSSSMPSRSYPLTIRPEFDLYLHTLNSENEPTSSSSSSLSSIAKKLHNLEGIYDCVDNLLLLPHTQQIFTRERREKWFDEILDGYLGLVDTCATAKDFISQSKDYNSNLLSVLRRKRVSQDLSEFISSRKTIKKQIQKSLRNIGSYKKNSFVLTGDKYHETIAIIRMFKEIERTTFELFEALLSSVSGETSSSRPSKWSLVSKLMWSRKVSCHEHKSSMLIEFGDLDASLSKSVSKCETGSKIEELQQQLREMDLIIRVIEERLECLFKRLIKSRVSLLNMQSQL